MRPEVKSIIVAVSNPSYSLILNLTYCTCCSEGSSQLQLAHTPESIRLHTHQLPNRYTWTGTPVRFWSLEIAEKKLELSFRNRHTNCQLGIPDRRTLTSATRQFFSVCSSDRNHSIYLRLNELRMSTGPCRGAIRRPVQLFCIWRIDKMSLFTTTTHFLLQLIIQLPLKPNLVTSCYLKLNCQPTVKWYTCTCPVRLHTALTSRIPVGYTGTCSHRNTD